MIRACQTLLMFLTLAVPVFAQKAFTIEKRTVITGLEKPEVVEGIVLVQGKLEPVFKEAAFVELIDPAGQTVVRASQQDRTPVTVLRLTESKFLIPGVGKIWVRVTNVDFTNQRFIDEETVFELGEVLPQPGPGPEPGPGPGPAPQPDTVPSDPFDNIGQRVAGWTAGQPNNKLLGEIYLKYSKILVDQPLRTINDVSAAMVGEINAVPNYATNYGTLRTNLNADIVLRWPMTRWNLADYYKAVAAGLGVR